MKRDEALKLAEQGFEELAKSLEAGKSDKLMEWMSVMARFSSYSFRNCLLIVQQKPEATFVAGYRKWPEFGRHVKKGEKGIAILAPLVYKKKEEQESSAKQNANEEGPKRVLAGFKVTHVFDVSQTEGDDLPELYDVSGDAGPWIERLETVVGKAGIKLEECDTLGSAEGMSSGGTVTLAVGLSGAKRFSVLAHELAHEEMHRSDRRKETTKKIRETEAEAVANIVSKAVGLDSDQSASDYIQMYQGDADVLMKSLDIIQKTAASIIERLHAEANAQELVA